jgi:hypothetical protein
MFAKMRSLASLALPAIASILMPPAIGIVLPLTLVPEPAMAQDDYACGANGEGYYDSYCQQGSSWCLDFTSGNQYHCFVQSTSYDYPQPCYDLDASFPFDAVGYGYICVTE